MSRAEDKMEKLSKLYTEWEGCTRCRLCEPFGRTRKSVAFGQGNPDATIVVIADSPTTRHSEDSSPLGDAQGEIVDMYLDAMKSSRDEVFITNLVACRATEEKDPNKSRQPTAPEVSACLPRVAQILETIDPFVVIVLGGSTLKALSPVAGGISKAAKDPFIRNVRVVTPGKFAPVRRMAFATWSPKYLSMNWSMEHGGPVRQAFDTWEKAFTVADRAANIYRGDSIPDRKVEDE